MSNSDGGTALPDGDVDDYLDTDEDEADESNDKEEGQPVKQKKREGTRLQR